MTGSDEMSLSFSACLCHCVFNNWQRPDRVYCFWTR